MRRFRSKSWTSGQKAILKMGSNRMRQVNEELRHRIAEILVREIELPPGTFVTVTEIKTARDLQSATVLVTVLPDDRRQSVVNLLQKQHARIQQQLATMVRIKFTPTLTFELDRQAMKAQHLFDVMDRLSPQ